MLFAFLIQVSPEQCSSWPPDVSKAGRQKGGPSQDPIHMPPSGQDTWIADSALTGQLSSSGWVQRKRRHQPGGQLGRVIFYGRITVHEGTWTKFYGKKDLVINNILHIKSLSPAPTPPNTHQERLHTQQSLHPVTLVPNPANSFSNYFKSQEDFAGSDVRAP